ALISALVAEFGAEVTRLSLALFTEAPTAQEATIEAFTAALSAPYHSESGVRAWFMRAALTRLNENESHFRQSSPAQGAYKAGSPSREKALDQAVLQAVSQQRFRARLILLLHHLLQWPLDQIAVALDVSESEVRLELEQIQNAV